MNLTITPKPKFTSLVNEIYCIIEARIDDTELDVEHLARSVSMSKASLHRKLKVATGHAPGHLIQIYRLNRAVQYLQSGYSSSQTAYKTGFDSPAYFSKCFRNYFGVTPIQVRTSTHF